VEYILAEFGPELRRRAVSNRLIRASGLIYYIITVLILELAVMLIQENIKVCDETVRQILQVSAHLGETLHDNV
jgi:RTC4-like domain